MEILIVNQSEVRELLPIRECTDVMAEALTALANDEAIMPLRSIMWLPQKVGALGSMPAHLATTGATGMKVLSVFFGNRGTKLDTHQGGVMLFDPQNGRLLALMDATEITSIRTAAVTAVATDALARAEASNLAILGSGTQAHTHLEAMRQVRPIRSVRVWSQHEENARAFAARESQFHDLELKSARSAEEAVSGADIICTVTSAKDPILQGRWLQPGAHVNAVGASASFARELDTEAVVRCKMFVDSRESALNEAGDFLFPKKEGVIDESHIRGELGNVLAGGIEGRTSAEEITLFKSLGLAIEDIASASYIYQKAQAQGLGTRVELGGSRHEGT